MLIADTSAWVEWLREQGSSADEAMNQALARNEVLLPEIVRAELLTGARSRMETAVLRRLVEAMDLVLIAPRDDFESATDLYLRGRAAGVTIRGLMDCMVVATAARLEVPVLHHDRDIARLAPLAGVAIATGSLELMPPV
jgi:predicted nucleic acid-binding protein